MIDPEIGQKVPHCHIGPAKVTTDQIQHRPYDGETEVTEKDQLGILSLVKGAGWIEVVNAPEIPVPFAFSASLRLAGMEVVSRNVSD